MKFKRLQLLATADDGRVFEMDIDRPSLSISNDYLTDEITIIVHDDDGLSSGWKERIKPAKAPQWVKDIVEAKLAESHKEAV